MTRASKRDFYTPDKYDLPLMRQKMYALRKANNYTQPEIAEKIGVTLPTYSRAEAGLSKSLSKNIIRKLIEVFGASEQELVVPRDKKIVSVEFEKWIEDRNISESYLKRAYMQYLKDTGKFPK